VFLNSFSLSGLLIFITTFILFLIILRHSKAKVHKTWALTNLCVSIWGLSSFYIGKALVAEEALLWWRISAVGVILIPVFLYHTVWLVCNLKQKKLLIFAYIQGIFFIFTAFSNFYFKSIELKFQYIYYPRAGILLVISFILFLFLIFYSHIVLFKSYRKFNGIKRKHISYFLFGSFLASLGGIPNFLPFFDINFYPYFNSIIPLYPLIITYAIFRYRLLDISIVISRLLMSLLLYPLALWSIMAAIYWKKDMLLKSIGYDRLDILLILSTSLIATFLTFLFIFIQHKAENRLLLKKRITLQKLLQTMRNITLIKDMHKVIEM
jgi:hypothetical protein